jgi:sugar phosphate permease|tara:strand:+ start:501 stop:674 length:174 start_codon:yes stop_codon:yes gene_type:complete
MIFPLGGIVLGALIGAVRAKMRGGTVMDMVQWGVAFAVMLGIIGLFILVFLQRAAVA